MNAARAPGAGGSAAFPAAPGRCLNRFVNVRLTSSEFAEARVLARQDERTLTAFAGRMFLRGLDAYKAELAASKPPHGRT